MKKEIVRISLALLLYLCSGIICLHAQTVQIQDGDITYYHGITYDSVFYAHVERVDLAGQIESDYYSYIVSDNVPLFVTSETEINLMPGFDMLPGSKLNAQIAVMHNKKYAVMLPKQMAGYFVVEGNLLNFKFTEKYRTQTDLNVSLYNYMYEDIISQVSFSSATNVAIGDNFYSLNINTLPSGNYTLRVRNGIGEKWYLRFRVE